MFDDPGHANNNRPLPRRLFSSLRPGARPKHFWVAMVVIVLLGLSGVAFLFML